MTMAFPSVYIVSTDTSTDFPQNGIMLMLTDITDAGVYTYTASGNSQVMIMLNETNYSLTDNGVDSLELEITDT